MSAVISAASPEKMDRYLQLLHLQLYNLSLEEYLTDRYALWLEFRTIDENELYGMGRRTENASEGITLQIEKNQNHLRLSMLTFTSSWMLS